MIIIKKKTNQTPRIGNEPVQRVEVEESTRNGLNMFRFPKGVREIVCYYDIFYSREFEISGDKTE